MKPFIRNSRLRKKNSSIWLSRHYSDCKIMLRISEASRYLTVVQTATSRNFTLNLSDETWYMFCLFCFTAKHNFILSLKAESRLSGRESWALEIQNADLQKGGKIWGYECHKNKCSNEVRVCMCIWFCKRDIYLISFNIYCYHVMIFTTHQYRLIIYNTHQIPLSMGFPRQEEWSGLLCLPLGYLPSPGIKPTSPTSPALIGRFFTTSATWEAHLIIREIKIKLTWKCLLNLWKKKLCSEKIKNYKYGKKYICNKNKH